MPANPTGAGIPPMVAVAEFGDRTLPPWAVPSAAGWEESTTVGLMLNSTAPWPVPCEFVVKIAGANAAGVTVTALLVKPFTTTATVACVLVSSRHGTWKVICVEVTSKSGAGTPSTSTITPPSCVGNGKTALGTCAGPRFVPKTAAMEPPTMLVPYLAESTTPPGLITGVVPEATRKLNVPDSPPPGAGLLTLIWAVAAATRSEAGIVTWSWVSEMNCVGRALPFHSTVEALLKPSPFTSTAVAALPAGAADGVIHVASGAGLATVNVAGAPATASKPRLTATLVLCT